MISDEELITEEKILQIETPANYHISGCTTNFPYPGKINDQDKIDETKVDESIKNKFVENIYEPF